MTNQPEPKNNRRMDFIDEAIEHGYVEAVLAAPNKKDTPTFAAIEVAVTAAVAKLRDEIKHTHPQPRDDAYQAYALISNALGAAFQAGGLSVRLSRREYMARLVWSELVNDELQTP